MKTRRVYTAISVFFGLLLISTTGSVESLANPDCATQARDLFSQAQREQASGHITEARILYKQVVDLCDQAEYWLALGDIWARDAEGLSENASENAIDAYSRAYEAARRDRDKETGAAAARAITKQGLVASDPIKANSWLIIARQLSPENSELDTLQEQVDLAMADLTPTEIETGFSGTRGVGRASSLLHGGTGASDYWKAPPEPDPSVSAREIDPRDSGSGGAGSDLSVISIPIKFEFNSLSVTSATASNLESLASVLASLPKSTGITFIGHADLRGDANYNLLLSQRRAEAIRDIVELLEPPLRGRIKAIGRGEAEPIDFGTSERAHANNRRLEISLHNEE